MVKGLLAKGYAYSKDGSVYFSLANFQTTGNYQK